MSGKVDIRVEVDEQFRREFRAQSDLDGLTYREFLRLLLDFRQRHEEEWQAYREGGAGRRPSGTVRDDRET